MQVGTAIRDILTDANLSINDDIVEAIAVGILRYEDPTDEIFPGNSPEDFAEFVLNAHPLIIRVFCLYHASQSRARQVC